MVDRGRRLSLAPTTNGTTEVKVTNPTSVSTANTVAGTQRGHLMRGTVRGANERAGIALALLLCVCLALAACGTTDGIRRPGDPTAIPDLQGKGVSRLPGLDAELQSADVIGWLATYVASGQEATGTPIPAATAAPSATDAVRVITVVGYKNGQYEDVGLHGATPHQLALAIPCVMGLSVTQDGHWGACITSQGVATFRLPAPNVTSGPLEEHIVASVDPGYEGMAVSWDSTGRYLALAQMSATDTSALAPLDILALSPQHEHATLAVQVSGLPPLAEVRWSPDGRWLGISTRTPVGYGYLIPLKHLLPTFPSYAQAAVQTTVTLAGLQPAPYYTAWRPGAASQVTVIEDGHLHLFDPATGVTHDVADLGFTPDNRGSSVCAETWTSDGRYFVFALCYTAGLVGLPPKIFIYDAQAQ